MATHTETAPRFPAWLVVALIVVGAGLGFWQIGVFDRSFNGGRGASAGANAGQPSIVAVAPAAGTTAGESALMISRSNGREAQRPINSMDLPASEPDPEVREESNALQEALAAEQASH